MKKHFLLLVAALLIIAMVAGCGSAPNEETNPTEAPTIEDPTQITQTPTEGQDDSGLTAHYIDVVYAEQIGRYDTALNEAWDIDQYFENDMSMLPYYYYDGNPQENVGFGFVDLDNDGSWELVIGAILNAELDPAVFEIWTLVDGKPVMLAQSSTENRYVLQYIQEKQTWRVANEVSNNGANWATYYLALQEGNWEVKQGIVFDALADEQNPWFKTGDMDWNVSNDAPIDAETANAIQTSNREYYTALDYLPYTSYEAEPTRPPMKTLKELQYERADALSQRFGVDIRIPEQSELRYSHYDAYALDDLTFLRSALDVLEQTLSRYPEGFFRQLAYGPIETVRFELVGSLTVKEGVDIDADSTHAFAQNLGDYYLVVLSAYFTDTQSLCHEISHLTDAYLAWDAINREDALFSEQTWLALQPEGFYYAMSYTNIPDELYSFAETDYFGHWYMTTYPTEDRAMLMEAAMLNNTQNFASGSGRRAKLQYYAECIRDCFDTTGWPEVAPWEQVLEETAG